MIRRKISAELSEAPQPKMHGPDKPTVPELLAMVSKLAVENHELRRSVRKLNYSVIRFELKASRCYEELHAALEENRILKNALKGAAHELSRGRPTLDYRYRPWIERP